MEIILIFFVAVSLSMDAFSLSLAYGTINLNKKDIILLSMVVGIYHFFMPIFGMITGNYINDFFRVSGDVLILVTFSIIGINMILESRKLEPKIKYMKLIEIIGFGLAVSIDSFSIGIGINNISNDVILCSSIFSMTSFIFTYVGLMLGKKLNLLIGKMATFFGGISLIFLGIIYTIK